MTILYLTPVHPLLTQGFPLPRWQTQMSHVRSLEELGHHVSVVTYTPNDHIQLSLSERVIYNTKIALFSGKADVVFLSLGADVLFSATIQLLKKKLHVPLIVLSGVSPVTNGNPRERSIAKSADIVATNDPSHAREWRELGARQSIVLPISAIDPALHYPRKVKRDIDILFVGTVTPDRERFFQKFRKLLAPGISFVIKHHVFEEEYAKLLSRAKIVLNPIRPEMRHGANLRLFEIPAFGALQLSSFTKKEWFEEKKEIVTYQDTKDAVGKARYYVQHEKERRKIVEIATERVFKEHTFKKRFEKLIAYE